MDDIAQLFRTHKILIDDDVVSFAPSEHLRNKCLLECLWNLKLSVWPMICDILLNTKSMRHVGSQLMEGNDFLNVTIRTKTNLIHTFNFVWLMTSKIFLECNTECSNFK